MQTITCLKSFTPAFCHTRVENLLKRPGNLQVLLFIIKCYKIVKILSNSIDFLSAIF